ncbi:type III secretion system inner membrane ring subunit SctD [Endozoicomonas ascidiicola]|uniref:type III secretion system inner membrane ring subunit SctD n=1 Tax=Endozoicomonas ascidiicola TaxID=1698521 RepID=UPI00083256E5|nr:type III secretion system inner membrane ring subunit SctD [Endozoicomonas ascidiicola]
MTEFYLKILSGNHIGAEIPLEPGRYALGKGETCDLVLTDDQLDDIQLTIEISDNGEVKLQSNNSGMPLIVNGQPAGNSIQYSTFDVIQCNSLYIALGPSNTEWPQLNLSSTNTTPPAPAQETASNEASGQEDDVHHEEVELSANDFADNSFSKDALDSFYDESTDGDHVSSFNKKWLLAIPAVLFIGIISLMVLVASTDNDTKQTVELPDPLATVKRVKQSLGLKDITFKLLPDQTIMIVGYTQTQQDKNKLQKTLREQDIAFRSQIAVMNEMRDNAESLLKIRGYDNLELELDITPGSLVLSGYVATSDELDKIINILKQEVHGLTSVVDQVENQAGRVNTLKSMLREKALIPRLQVLVRGKTILLKGHLLDEGQVYDLQTIVTKFKQRYDNKPAIQLATKYSSGLINDNASPLVLNIRGISMGRVPYVILIDGTKYLIGAKLSNGFTIEDINIDYLLLTNGTSRFKYRLGGNRGGNNEK